MPTECNDREINPGKLSKGKRGLDIVKNPPKLLYEISLYCLDASVVLLFGLALATGCYFTWLVAVVCSCCCGCDCSNKHLLALMVPSYYYPQPFTERKIFCNPPSATLAKMRSADLTMKSRGRYHVCLYPRSPFMHSVSPNGTAVNAQPLKKWSTVEALIYDALKYNWFVLYRPYIYIWLATYLRSDNSDTSFAIDKFWTYLSRRLFSRHCLFWATTLKGEWGGRGS